MADKKPKAYKVYKDIKHISDAGFDHGLIRNKFGQTPLAMPKASASDLGGGIIGKEAPIYLGNKLYKMDGENSRTVVYDGSNPVILFGKRPNGTYGMDIATAGDSVFNLYREEMLFSSDSAGDWMPLTESLYSYTSSSRIAVSDLDASTTFQVGDKMRFKQTGATSYQYCYITGKAAAYVNVRGGTSFSLTNLAFTEIAISRASSPVGFPIPMYYTPTITAESPLTIVTTNLADYCRTGFTMIGKNIILTISISQEVGGSAGTNIILTLPVPFDDSPPTGLWVSQLVIGSLVPPAGTQQTGRAATAYVASTTNVVNIYRFPAANITPSAGNSLTFDGTLIYTLFD